MSPEKEAELQSLCLVFLRDLNVDPMQTCMAWGLEVGDGWYESLKKAFLQIEELNKTSKAGKVIADQVKTKFGECRIYWHIEEVPGISQDLWKDLAQEVEKIVTEAENTCDETCEICGAPAKECTARWITLCPKCEKEREGEGQRWAEMGRKSPSDSDSH